MRMLGNYFLLSSNNSLAFIRDNKDVKQQAEGLLPNGGNLNTRTTDDFVIQVYQDIKVLISIAIIELIKVDNMCLELEHNISNRVVIYMID